MKKKLRQKIRSGILFASFLLFPVYISYLSPVMILGGAYEGIITGSFVLFGLMFLSGLVLGRGWCGWLCPASGLQEACEPFREKKAKTGVGNVIRWVVWVVWIGMIVFFFIRAGGVHQVDIDYQTDPISILNPILVYVYLGVVLGVFLMVMIWGNRAFCKYLCWMGPFMILGDKIRHELKLPGYYLKDTKDACIRCRKCSKACPMDIDVQEMVAMQNTQNDECILCLQCVDVCPTDAITAGWQK